MSFNSIKAFFILLVNDNTYLRFNYFEDDVFSLLYGISHNVSWLKWSLIETGLNQIISALIHSFEQFSVYILIVL